jgi:TctA family transporter
MSSFIGVYVGVYIGVIGTIGAYIALYILVEVSYFVLQRENLSLIDVIL